MIKGSLFSQEAAPSCFRRSTNLPKVPSTKSLFREWTKFWFRGPKKYVEPSLRTSKNRTKPRMNHGPSGNIDVSFLPRTEEENAPFVELGVKESFRDETYLAAFLLDGSWRNIFFGSSDPSKHLSWPSSIYRGLRDISTSPNLGACNTLLPFHYVYGWIGEYFETYFRVTLPQRGLRSSFVTLRLDDELIVEPYSPHRFSRQFRYYQDVLGALIEHHYDGSLLTLVQLWDLCVYLGSSSKIIIPMRPSNKRSLMTHSISIDTAIFEDGAAGSTMPLTELAHQLGLGDIPSDVDVFEDCITSSNSLNVVKSSHLPLVEVKSQAANEIQLTKSMVPFSEKVEISQNISTTNVGVVETSQIGCSVVSRDLVRPLLRIASNFEPQKTISSFKLSYFSGMWRILCECITQFSVESPENLTELEASVALILKGLREVKQRVGGRCCLDS
uniref:Aminotransferase-like plant mobile domain-containing protein n=1 Tax=Solanum tuberosum TaxID=4113 RepID=M1BIN9_SOLTU